MKANELRIGNLVKGGMHGRTVVSIEDDGIIAECHEDDGTPDFPSSVEPIPLTREWLLKFSGWIEHTSNDETQIIGWSNGDVLIDHLFQFQFGRGLIKIEFVHQLQNLYFALTGEELTIKTED